MALLSEQQIEAELSALEGWERSGATIRRAFDFGDFMGSVGFVNRIAPVAEEMNHHPDLEISWATVTVTLSTHSQGGLTEADFRLARRVETLA